jgi:hypothetical protein
LDAEFPKTQRDRKRLLFVGYDVAVGSRASFAEHSTKKLEAGQRHVPSKFIYYQKWYFHAIKAVGKRPSMQQKEEGGGWRIIEKAFLLLVNSVQVPVHVMLTL